MIQIKVNNEFLDTSEDLSIPFEFYSNLFEFETLYNSRSFSFSVARTAKNKRILEFDDIISATLYINQITVTSIIIKITKIAETSISLSIEFLLNKLFEKIKGYTLGHLTSEYFSQTPTGYEDKYYPETSLYFPTISFNQHTCIVNYYDTENKQYIKDLSQNKFIQGFFALGFVIENIFKFAGYAVNENIFKTDPFLKKIMVLQLTSYYPDSDYITFGQALPSMLIRKFLTDCIKIFNLLIIVEGSAVSVKTRNNYLFNESEVLLSDIEVQNILPLYKKVTYKSITTSTPHIIEYNFSPAGEKELSIEFDYKIYNSYYAYPYAMMEITDNTSDTTSLKLAVYKFEDNIPYANIGDADTSMSLYPTLAHFFYTYLLQSLLLQNKLLKKINAKIVFDYIYLSKILNINVINYNNKLYFIEKIAGNITGNEKGIMNLTAYTID